MGSSGNLIIRHGKLNQLKISPKFIHILILKTCLSLAQLGVARCHLTKPQLYWSSAGSGNINPACSLCWCLSIPTEVHVSVDKSPRGISKGATPSNHLNKKLKLHAQCCILEIWGGKLKIRTVTYCFFNILD